MNILGILHTAISVAALVVAAVCLFQDKAIKPNTKWGNIYSLLTAVACISAFGLSKSGHFNPGHALGIMILVLLGVSYYLSKKSRAIVYYVILFCMTTTLFLSLVPGINETLSRLPVGHPIASGPTDPIVQNSLKVLVLLYVVGLIVQFVQLRKTLKKNDGQLFTSTNKKYF